MWAIRIRNTWFECHCGEDPEIPQYWNGKHRISNGYYYGDYIPRTRSVKSAKKYKSKKRAENVVVKLKEKYIGSYNIYEVVEVNTEI